MHCKKNGFSLLEILLAMALGLLLLACVFQVYFSIKSLSVTIADNARLQNNLRFISHFLHYHISTAGYSGCGQIKYLDVKNYSDFPFTAANIVRGFNSNNLPTELKKYKIAPNTDVIVIQNATAGAAEVTDDIKAGAKSFYVTANPATKYNDPLLLADCVNADLFNVINVGGTLIRSQDRISHKYAAGAATVSRFTEIAYFISQNSLYYAINYGNKAMLADGITSMQIRYGVDGSGKGTVNNYYMAEEVATRKLWEKVTGVIITLTHPSAAAKASTWDIYIKLRERGL